MKEPPRHQVSEVTLGQHVIADYFGADRLIDCKPAAVMLQEAAETAKATVLDIKLHDFGERAGFTGVALLAESHISLHTWPERSYVAVDIFMCGDADPMLSLGVIKKYFAPEHEQVQVLKRGTLARPIPPVRSS